MNRYHCELPVSGSRFPAHDQVEAPNKREAAREASRRWDAYCNKSKLAGHRMQRTPASHWTVRRIR